MIANGQPATNRKPPSRPKSKPKSKPKRTADTAEDNTHARESLLRWCLFARGVLEHLARDAHDLLTAAHDEDHPMHEFLYSNYCDLEEVRTNCAEAAGNIMNCEPYPIPSITIPDPFAYADDSEDENQ